MTTEQTIDVEMIFALSPPAAGRPGRLAASRRRAAMAAVAAAATAASLLVLFAFL